MNKVLFLLTIFIIYINFVQAEPSSSSLNWVSMGYFRENACLQGGSCNLTSLTSANITVYDFNVTGDIDNRPYNIYTTNITMSCINNAIYSYDSDTDVLALGECNSETEASEIIFSSDINMYGKSIFNATNITASKFCNETTCFLLSDLNKTYVDDDSSYLKNNTDAIFTNISSVNDICIIGSNCLSSVSGSVNGTDINITNLYSANGIGIRFCGDSMLIGDTSVGSC